MLPAAKQAADKAARSSSSSTPTTTRRPRTAQSRTISPGKWTASCSRHRGERGATRHHRGEDARIPNGDNAAFIGVDNKGAGEEIGKYFADYVETKMGGSAKVGGVGALNSFMQNQRMTASRRRRRPSRASSSSPSSRSRKPCRK
jgi:hypothetical protein